MTRGHGRHLVWGRAGGPRARDASSKPCCVSARAPPPPTSRRSSWRQTVDLFRQRRLALDPRRGRDVHSRLRRGPDRAAARWRRWTATYRDRDGVVDHRVSRLPLDYAQGAAEDYVRRTGAQALVDPHAAWRTRPASERQLQALRRFRVPVTPDLTAGEASDHLARAIALARECRG